MTLITFGDHLRALHHYERQCYRFKQDDAPPRAAATWRAPLRATGQCDERILISNGGFDDGEQCNLENQGVCISPGPAAVPKIGRLNEAFLIEEFTNTSNHTRENRISTASSSRSSGKSRPNY